MNVIERLKNNRNSIVSIAEKHGARNIRVIGSYARGDSGPESDLDLLVSMESGRSLLDHAALVMDLEAFLNCKVDIASDRNLRKRVKDRVLKDAVPI